MFQATEHKAREAKEKKERERLELDASIERCRIAEEALRDAQLVAESKAAVQAAVQTAVGMKLGDVARMKSKYCDAESIFKALAKGDTELMRGSWLMKQVRYSPPTHLPRLSPATPLTQI